MQPSTRKGFGSDIPDFTSFHLRLDAALKKEYARVLAVQDKMSPCLLKAGFVFVLCIKLIFGLVSSS